MSNSQSDQTMDAYILSQTQEAQRILIKLRAIVKEEAPEVEERIRWQMPTFYLKGNLVHFAAHKNHIGFYPGEHGVTAFLELSEDYRTSKGAIQFPYNKPVPYDLVRNIVALRVKENLKNSSN